MGWHIALLNKSFPISPRNAVRRSFAVIRGYLLFGLFKHHGNITLRNAQLLGSVFLPHILVVDHGINFAFLFIEDAFTLLKNDLFTEKRLNVAVVTSPWHLRRATELAKCLMPKTVSVYGYHAEYEAQRAGMKDCPALLAHAENELRFLREAVECGFADDFEM